MELPSLKAMSNDSKNNLVSLLSSAMNKRRSVLKTEDADEKEAWN